MPESIEKYIPKQPTFRGMKLGAKTIDALEMMATKGMSLSDAAKRLGIRKDNLQRVFDKPHVRERFEEVVRFVVDNEGLAAFLRISELSKTASSEHVRLEASKWLAGVDGFAPVKRVESAVSHRHTFGGFSYDGIGKDVTLEDDRQAH